jgi:hypothetical protein
VSITGSPTSYGGDRSTKHLLLDKSLECRIPATFRKADFQELAYLERAFIRSWFKKISRLVVDKVAWG